MEVHSQSENNKEEFSNVEIIVQNNEDEEGESETANILTGLERR